MSNAIDVSKDIKEKRDAASDVVIFIDAIKDYLACFTLIDKKKLEELLTKDLDYWKEHV